MSGASVVLGVCLVVLGAMVDMPAPGQPQELGPKGLKIVLRDFAQAAEQRDEQEAAKVLDQAAEAMDERWFQDYLESEGARHPNPSVRAMALENAYGRRAGQT